MPNGFNPKGIWQPDSRGFSMGYVQPEGRVIHFTGQVGWDENEVLVGANDVKAQTRQAYRNVELVLREVGGDLDDIVAVTTYYLFPEHLPLIQSVRQELFSSRTPPTSTSIMVAGLGHPDFLVEIAPIAIIPQARFKMPVTD